jgi:choline dehydrogenase-like flavoprotein
MHRVHAKREIILACGSIKSPQLLELSGIGDPVNVQAAGISLQVPLPDVGNNLQEHPISAVTYELSPESETLDSLFSDPSLFGDFMSQYMTTGDGPIGGCMSLTGFLPYISCTDEPRVDTNLGSDTSTSQVDALTTEMLRDSKSASLQFTCVPANFSPQSGHDNLSRVMPGAPAGRGPCYTILVSNAYALSKGSVHITTSDPFAAPMIDLGLFRESIDVDVLAAGVAFADKAFRSHHVADQVVQRISPPASLDMDEAEQVRQYVKDQVLIFNHLLGTCAIGKVVDDRLRVKDVRGLRVVDASVIPIQMSGNIIATVYAIAERAADMIKQDASVAYTKLL